MELVKQPDTPEFHYEGYVVTAFDPYGFWRITSKENGKVPAALGDNTFTSRMQAATAIDAYIREASVVKEKPATLTK